MVADYLYLTGSSRSRANATKAAEGIVEKLDKVGVLRLKELADLL